MSTPANCDLNDYLGQLRRNNLEPSFGAYMEPATGWNGMPLTVGTIHPLGPRDPRHVVGYTEAHRNSRNALGHEPAIDGDNQGIISTFDLKAMQERIAKLEKMVEQLWRMSAVGPMRQKTEQQVNESTIASATLADTPLDIKMLEDELQNLKLPRL